MNLQETIQKWLMTDRDTIPLWRLPINEIEVPTREDLSDGVEIAALAENIRQCGLIHPIIVEKQNKGKKYKLVSGKRRLEAVALLGRTHISALLVKSGCLTNLQVSLSENIMRKSPHFLDLAEDIETLLKKMSVEEAARLFSVKENYIRRQLMLTSLSAYEKRLIRLLALSESDALELCEIENSNIRKLLLEKMLEMGGASDRSSLIAQAKNATDYRFLQSEKIYVRDVRVFVNTLDRAVEMMRSAGFHVEMAQNEDLQQYEFTIIVDKMPTCPAKGGRAPSVSRETSDKKKKRNVSRETSENPPHPIDEAPKP